MVENTGDCLDHISCPAFLCSNDLDIIFINDSAKIFLGFSSVTGMDLTNLHQIESVLGMNLDPEALRSIPEEQKRVKFSNLQGQLKQW